MNGKTIWITGASSGIGEGLAKAWAARGATLILSGRNVAELERVAGECSGDHLVLPFDTTDFEALPALAAQAKAHNGRIDVLVNNAGISQRSLAIETDMRVYHQIIDIDLKAPIALTQAVLPTMVAQGSGQIVMISSVAGLVGSPLRTAYSAAKHGLVGYADALRSEVAALGIEVYVVAPGSVKTQVSVNALDATGTPRGFSDDAIENGISTAEAADRILAAIDAKQREFVLAGEMEAGLVAMRRSNPDGLFDMVEAFMAGGYAEQVGAVRKAD